MQKDNGFGEEAGPAVAFGMALTAQREKLTLTGHESLNPSFDVGLSAPADSTPLQPAVITRVQVRSG